MEFYAGSAVAVAIAAPLYGVLFTGTHAPVHLDMSVMESYLASADRRAAALLAYQYTGELMMKRRQVGELRVGHGIRRCKDGYISIHAGGPRLPRLLAMLGEESGKQLPTIAEARTEEGRSRIEEVLWQWLGEHTRDEVWEAALRHKVPLAPVRTPMDIAAARRSQDKSVTLELPPFEARPGYWSHARGPRLGEHNRLVYGGLLGITPGEQMLLRRAGVM